MDLRQPFAVIYFDPTDNWQAKGHNYIMLQYQFSWYCPLQHHYESIWLVHLTVSVTETNLSHQILNLLTRVVIQHLSALLSYERWSISTDQRVQSFAHCWMQPRHLTGFGCMIQLLQKRDFPVPSYAFCWTTSCVNGSVQAGKASCQRSFPAPMVSERVGSPPHPVHNLLWWAAAPPGEVWGRVSHGAPLFWQSGIRRWCYPTCPNSCRPSDYAKYMSELCRKVQCYVQWKQIYLHYVLVTQTSWTWCLSQWQVLKLERNSGTPWQYYNQWSQGL